MTAAATVGMGKPVAVLLILLLLTGASAPGLCVGALVGYGAARLLPARAGHGPNAQQKVYSQKCRQRFLIKREQLLY